MNYDRDRAMYEQECTEAMIRMRDPEKAIKRKAAQDRFDRNEHRMIDRVTGEPRGFPPAR